MGIAIRCTLVLMAMAITGCAHKPVARDDNAALVIASCPVMGEVDILTPADTWRLLVEDAKLYNTCRCAALRNTKFACPEPKPEPAKPTT